MDTIATLKSLSPKRRRKKDAQVKEDQPPQELCVGDVVFLGDGTDGYLRPSRPRAASFKSGEGGGVPTYKLGCLWQLFPDSDYRRERLVRLGDAFELRKASKPLLSKRNRSPIIVKGCRIRFIERHGAVRRGVPYRACGHGQMVTGDGEPAESGGGCLRLSLATDLERSKYCRFRIAPGYRARGLGTPVFDGDGVRLEAQALDSLTEPPRTVATDVRQRSRIGSW